jgi:hypothetical protein
MTDRDGKRKQPKPRQRNVGHKQTAVEEYIQWLKADPYWGVQVRVSDAEDYRIKTVSRGEQVLYQENERAVLVDIDSAQNALATKSIRRWDDGTPVSDEERAIIVQRLVRYLTRPGSRPVLIVD